MRNRLIPILIPLCNRYVLSIPLKNLRVTSSAFTEKCSQNPLLTHMAIVNSPSMCSVRLMTVIEQLNYQYRRIPITCTWYLTTVLVLLLIPIWVRQSPQRNLQQSLYATGWSVLLSAMLATRLLMVELHNLFRKLLNTERNNDTAPSYCDWLPEPQGDYDALPGSGPHLQYNTKRLNRFQSVLLLHICSVVSSETTVLIPRLV